MAHEPSVNHQPTAQWELIQRQCKAFIESGFLPQHIKNPAQAITIAWKGHELGIPPLVAFSSIVVINGKPALSAELMRSLVFRKYPSARLELITPVEKQTVEATYLAMRPGGKEQFFQFNKSDAEAAGLFKPNSPWLKFPKAMYQARASAMACRSVFPDALMGCVYTPEELGGEVIEGEVVESIQTVAHEEKTKPEPIAARSTSNTASYEKRHDDKMNQSATDAQHNKLYALSKKAKYSDDELLSLIKNVAHVNTKEELKKGHMDAIFQVLEEDIAMAKMDRNDFVSEGISG